MSINQIRHTKLESDKFEYLLKPDFGKNDLWHLCVRVGNSQRLF